MRRVTQSEGRRKRPLQFPLLANFAEGRRQRKATTTTPTTTTTTVDTLAQQAQQRARTGQVQVGALRSDLGRVQVGALRSRLGGSSRVGRSLDGGVIGRGVVTCRTGGYGGNGGNDGNDMAIGATDGEQSSAMMVHTRSITDVSGHVSVAVLRNRF